MKYLISGIDLVICTVIYYIIALFLPKNIWIVSEREDQAQDNGIAFFKYINQIDTDIYPVYLLEKGCKSIPEVSKIGKVILKGSFKHKMYFLSAKVIATTEKNIIEPWGSNLFYSRFARLYSKKLKVFLQHGITDKDVSAVYGKAVSHIDMFMTATDEEKQFIIDKFGYHQDEVKVTGLARYDYLWQHREQAKADEKIILYMPTWRRYLIDLANQNEQYIDKCRDKFQETIYFKRIQSLLESERLHQTLSIHNYKLVFITHHGMNSFGDLFTSNSSRIKIFKSDDVVIARWLVKANIFITDYSSIHFDSSYIGNSNIYYQFDKEEFQTYHAGKSYFDYKKDGFGVVVAEENELLEAIEREIVEDGVHKEIYNNRRKSFFKYSDNLNCERIYKEIKSKLDENSRK